MRSTEMLGIVSEVHLCTISDRPMYWQLDKYMRECGFDLYDLDIYRSGKHALPYPFLYDFRNHDGKPMPGPSIQGQVQWGDALYLRDSLKAKTALSARKIVASACLFEIFGLSDCAAELVLAHRSVFAAWSDPERLLDLLVPELKGQQFTYKEYVARDTTTDPLFPASSRRALSGGDYLALRRGIHAGLEATGTATEAAAEMVAVEGMTDQRSSGGGPTGWRLFSKPSDQVNREGDEPRDRPTRSKPPARSSGRRPGTGSPAAIPGGAGPR